MYENKKKMKRKRKGRERENDIYDNFSILIVYDNFTN